MLAMPRSNKMRPRASRSSCRVRSGQMGRLTACSNGGARWLGSSPPDATDTKVPPRRLGKVGACKPISCAPRASYC